VPALPQQVLPAVPKRGAKVESRNTASRTPQIPAIPAQDDCWPVERPQYARGYDTHNSHVPVLPGFHNDVVARRVESGSHALHRLIRDATLQPLALTVPLIQLPGQSLRLPSLGCDQQFKRIRCGVKPPSGIQAWRELEGDFEYTRGGSCSTHRHECL
jgi:hypothetical protein